VFLGGSPKSTKAARKCCCFLQLDPKQSETILIGTRIASCYPGLNEETIHVDVQIGREERRPSPGLSFFFVGLP